MKNLISFALAVLLVITFTACASNKPPETDTLDTSVPEIKVPDTDTLDTDAPDTDAPGTDTSEMDIPHVLPTLTIVDENGEPVGEVITIGIGEENGCFIAFATENIGEYNPKVGWDDTKLREAGMNIDMRFEPVFGIYIWAESAGEAQLKTYISAMEDWSDADKPPVLVMLDVVAE